MEQNKYSTIPSGLLDRLQRILSFANKPANEVICEEIKLLEELMPRMLIVMQMVAKFSRAYVRHGTPSSSRVENAVIVTRTTGGPETITDMNNALTKIIKYFSRAVDVEALHLPNETGVPLLFFRPSTSIGAPIGHLPVEIWQNILLIAIGSGGYYPLATSCTASTFLHFLKQETDPDGSYIAYVRRRATLRQVCRSWNQFLESTNAWWVHVQDPYHPQKSFGLPPIADQVAIVKRLSMTMTTYECVQPGLNWAFDLFQKVQVPILSYNISIPYNCKIIYGPYDFLAPITTKMALRNLRIASLGLQSCCSISFSQLSANFKNLVSLCLSGLIMYSTEELTLPRLEVLHISRYPGPPPLPTQGWNLPFLRHVYIAGILSTTDYNAVINFLRRYGSQLESLFLVEYPSRSGLPHDFWSAFTSLQLLGLRYGVLNDRSWSGWSIKPPRSHPFRYLVCTPYMILDVAVGSLRSLWTYHEDVALVIEDTSTCPDYYLIEDVKQESWRMRMTPTDGILPMRHPDKGPIS